MRENETKRREGETRGREREKKEEILRMRERRNFSLI